MYCQFVIVVLVCADMNLIFNIIWKLIIKKKEEEEVFSYAVEHTYPKYSQQQKTVQNAANNCKRTTGMEVRNTAQPIVLLFAQHNV